MCALIFLGCFCYDLLPFLALYIKMSITVSGLLLMLSISVQHSKLHIPILGTHRKIAAKFQHISTPVISNHAGAVDGILTGY